ncbi:MAG: PP2C family protein-serine/threonine phosphatase [Bacteroidia bacterium]
MKEFYHKLVNTGIHPETPFALRHKLRVFNTANFFIFLISVFYSLIGIRNGFYFGVTATVYSAVSIAAGFWLVKKGRYVFAFHFTMIYGLIFISAFTYLFGGENNSHYYLIFLPLACNILFDSARTTFAYVCVIALVLMGNVFFMDNYKPYYTIPRELHYFGYPNIVFICVLVYLGVRLFKLENVRYAKTIEEQRHILEEKNHEITDSINYAQKIQSALIPSEEDFVSHFNEAFVYFKPKDIVSGDFYWASKKGDKVFFAVADCTGHGVPGGFMTMLGISFLDEIINEKNVTRPDEILNNLRDRIITTLKQTGAAGESKDGMDVVVCCLDRSANTLLYAGANNSVYVVSNDSMNEFKADKQPCGFNHVLKPFTVTEIKLQQGDCIYAFSDGYADQFGGEKGKKFKYRQLEQILLRSNADFRSQKKLLAESFDNWKGDLEQVDDILLVGVRV